MKLSVENYDVRQKVGEEQALRLIAQAGFDCIDYSFYWQPDDWEVLGDGYREYAQTFRQLLQREGLECNQAHAPFRLRYNEPWNMDNPHYREIVRAIESAAIMGARQIVVHALTVPLEDRETNFEELNLAYYRSLEPVCQKAGIRIAVENLWQSDQQRKCFRGVLGTPRELNRFLNELNSPWFVACVDVGHASITDTEPQTFIREMQPELLKALHIQDTDYLGDRHLLPFAGDFNWAAIMESLKEKGYDGDLTLEIVRFFKTLPDALLPDALRYAASVGRYLISVFEK